MALTVNFWTFSKKENSTAIPATTGIVRTLSCVLKSDSGILSPVLEIGLGMTFNPFNLNYAQIEEYHRYYRVTDWQWSSGLWLCSLEVDPLASWKTHIGASSHYVLRSAYAHNIEALDEFYPALSWRPNYYTDSVSFGFSQSFGSGYYVVGIAAKGTGSGPVSYYILTPSEISDLVDYMLESPSDAASSWTNPFTGMKDILYRSIYSPFDYIKSCRWYPIGQIDSSFNQILRFGNYTATNTAGQAVCVGTPLGRNAANWPTYTQTLQLPPSWISLEARERTAPYAHLYIVFNPFGVIELNPLDFTNSTQIKLVLEPDYMSGDALLKIYKVEGTTDYFITQKTARIGVDINLTAATMDFSGFLHGAVGTVGSAIAAITAPGTGSMIASAVSAGAGIASTAAACVPTVSNSIGVESGGARAMDGTATLIYVSTYFAQEDNTDFGKPLLDTRRLDTIPGFIKCADGHIEIPAFQEEINRINEYLTGGFFYE